MRFVLIALLVLGACRHEKIVHDPARAPKGFKEVDVDTTKGEAPAGSTVVKVDGTAFELDNLWQKHRLLLVFYLGGWCPHCKRQLETLQQYQKDIADTGAVIAAVSVDPPETAKDLHENLKLQFEVFSDANLDVIRKWGVEDTGAHTALPATFIVEPGGAITYRKVGKSPTDRPTIEELLTALRNTQ
jgi:peroxiredoxin